MMCEKFENELFFLLFAYGSGLRTLFGGRVCECPSTFGEWRYRMTPEKSRSVKPMSY